jgi:hypothetical protein
VFFYRAGGRLKTPLPRRFTFTDPEKIRELARRGEPWGDVGRGASRQAHADAAVRSALV